jgi:adenylate cyclase
MAGRRPTLQGASIVALLALAVLLGAFLVALTRASRGAVVQSAGPLREASAELASRSVESYLQTAEDSIARIERGLLLGPCSAQDPRCAESVLRLELLANPDLVEAAFTHGGARWQVSLSRPYEGQGLQARTVRPRGAGFVAETRGGEAPSLGPAADPTLHPTFVTPASPPYREQLVWSDLSFTELDLARPEAQRRVVVTVMKAILAAGRLAGVARVSLLEDQVDALVARGQASPERLFIFDEGGRFLSRLQPGDPLRTFGEDLRVVPRSVPPEIAAALESPAAHSADEATLEVAGQRFLASFRTLRHTQGWRLGVVVQEDALPGIAALRDSQRRLLLVGALVAGLVLLGGLLGLGLIRGDLGRIVELTARMGRFDFAPGPETASFAEVGAVMAGLEKAKTSLRALSKYVPVDLVRLLYESGKEPFPGGEPHDCTLMFTDIQGFTTLSEEVPPDALARLLGSYFEVMAGAIRSTGGTIDKFIGDAVMALWNAPLPLPEHPGKACEAALLAIEATSRLYASPAWGQKPLRTRFGIHREVVLLGHFGAPDRLSYTVLGDGVNLASRLEGLNKAYGTTILASQSVRDAALGSYTFRLVDRVAVKGKTRGILVYELLGRVGTASPYQAYEEALARYWDRDFGGALRLLERLPDDPPSRVLAERCRGFLEEPPPEDWDRVFVATEK